ncbi:hypothetical protein ACLB2K_002442 [Fragaria x ananassa]
MVNNTSLAGIGRKVPRTPLRIQTSNLQFPAPKLDPQVTKEESGLIDDIVSRIKKKQPAGSKAPSKPQVETEGDAHNEQIIPE